MANEEGDFFVGEMHELVDFVHAGAATVGLEDTTFLALRGAAQSSTEVLVEMSQEHAR